MAIPQEVFDQWEREYDAGRMEFSSDVTEARSIDEIKQALKAFATRHSFVISISSYTVVDPGNGRSRQVVTGRKVVAI